jgi:hypothetical protein
MSEEDATRRTATALDYAQATAYEDRVGDEAREELRRTFAELKECFPDSAIREAAEDFGITANGPNKQAILEALRAFACIVIESDRPRLAAHLVGKLVGLELATGHRLILRELALSAGISKQAVSRHLANYAERLGLDRPDSTQAQRESHRLMNRRNYAH